MQEQIQMMTIPQVARTGLLPESTLRMMDRLHQLPTIKVKTRRCLTISRGVVALMDNNQRTPSVLTVRETVKRAREDGLYCTEYAVRRWILTGEVPSRNIGSKRLIWYPNLVRYLTFSESGARDPSSSKVE